MTRADSPGAATPTALRRWLDPFLDLVFPALCPVCRTRSDDPTHRPFCGACWLALPRRDGPGCATCDGDFPGLPPGMSCEACRLTPPPYAFLRAAGAYRDGLRAAIHAFKYRGRPTLAGPLGLFLAEMGGRRLPAAPAELVDAIVPLPLHPARAAERGFNQAELLARPCGARWGVPVTPRALRRARATHPQTDLDAGARRANVAGAFLGAPAAVAGRRLLLVDDVLTTGATAEAAVAALLDAGATRVGVLVLARVA